VNYNPLAPTRSILRGKTLQLTCNSQPRNKGDSTDHVAFATYFPQ